MWQGVPRFQRGALSPTGLRHVVLRAGFDSEEKEGYVYLPTRPPKVLIITALASAVVASSNTLCFFVQMEPFPEQ